MGAAYLAVARYRKPHGLKGEALLWVHTDDPGDVLVEGRELTPIDDEGRPVGEPLRLARARAYHRLWLVKFEGIEDRSVLESWSQILLGVERSSLAPPGDNEMYVHEIPGMPVIAHGKTIGHARQLIDVPGGRLLAVDVNGREVLVPFRPPILVGVRRQEGTIEIAPPEGLLEL